MARLTHRLWLSLAIADAAPLSAPAFSLVFPLLKMVLTEMPHHSEEEEEQMAHILQILTVHAQLRASPDTPHGRVDEVGRLLCYPLGFRWLREAGTHDFVTYEQFWWGNRGYVYIHSRSPWYGELFNAQSSHVASCNDSLHWVSVCVSLSVCVYQTTLLVLPAA